MSSDVMHPVTIMCRMMLKGSRRTNPLFNDALVYVCALADTSFRPGGSCDCVHPPGLNRAQALGGFQQFDAASASAKP